MESHESLPIVQTKLQPPGNAPFILPRARLHRQLDNAIERPVTLISAPAGFGKTTLLCTWQAECTLPCAWLSLDAVDNHLPAFLQYVIAALRTVAPTFGRDTQALLEQFSSFCYQQITATFLNDLNEIEEPFVLILDDYHHLQDEAINRFVGELLRHPPSTLSLILSARHDPPLPIAQWAVHGKLAEIRTRDMRFNEEEAAAYFRKAIPQPLPAETVDMLLCKTEGWAAALHLVLASLQRGAPPAQQICAMPGISIHLREYLTGEILARQPQDVQQFLLCTSILERMCPPLCDAILNQEDMEWDGDSGGARSQSILQQLRRDNLFVVLLDDEGQWCRYHTLFREMLQYHLHAQYGPDELATLHRRAARWYEAHGLVDDAIDHALAAEDEDAIVRMVQTHRHDYMKREQWHVLDAWLARIPYALVENQPELSMLEAWLAYSRHQWDDIPRILARIRSHLPPSNGSDAAESARHFQCEMDVLRAQGCLDGDGADSALQYAQRGLAQAPTHYPAVRGAAVSAASMARHRLGDTPGAFEMLYASLREERSHATPALTILCHLQWEMLDLACLKQTATHLLRLAEEQGLPHSMGWGHYYLGCCAYETNELAEAASHFAVVLERRHSIPVAAYLHSALGLALVHRAQGAFDLAQQLVEDALAFALHTAHPTALTTAQTFQAYLAALQGRVAHATPWATLVKPSAPIPPIDLLCNPSIVLAHMLLAKNTPTNRHEAERLLQELSAACESARNKRCLVKILLLQSLLSDARCETRKARRCLTRALQLAQPAGLIRVFVDLGWPMQRLLQTAGQKTAVSDYVYQLLAAFPKNEQHPVSHSPPALSSASHRDAPAPVIVAPLSEPITNRELDVLALLAQRLSNKEIARALSIELTTVKRHNHRIFQKLNVHNRREAVQQASALGLLPTSPHLSPT